MKSLIQDHYPVTCHTTHVGPGSTFVAVQGATQHGGNFIAEAIKRGATKIVVDGTFSGPEPVEVAVERVADAHHALGSLAAAALDYPAKKLTVIGVTGTKGKTSTCYLLFDMLKKNGIKAALLGTVENRIDDHIERSSMTTPTADYLQMFCATARAAGVTHVVMEVSAHALSYKKMTELPLDVAIFTNFAQDHLDFYGTMENYLAAKATIFEYLKPGAHLFLNADDQVSEQLLHTALACSLSAVQIHCIGMHDNIHTTDIFSAISENLDQLQVTTHEATYTTKGVVGTFNAYNVMMAVSAARALGISVTGVQKALQSFTGVPGRLYTIALSHNRFAVVDYSHNTLSTQAVLKLLRPHTHQLIVVFGCGGNRDVSRRSGMGAAVAEYADIAIITSDNPRFEDPQKIILDIIAGMTPRAGFQQIIEPDRAAAIAQGLAKLERGGILAVLGKGHERSQIIAGVCYPFDDAEVVCRLSSLA